MADRHFRPHRHRPPMWVRATVQRGATAQQRWRPERTIMGRIGVASLKTESSLYDLWGRRCRRPSFRSLVVDTDVGAEKAVRVCIQSLQRDILVWNVCLAEFVVEGLLTSGVAIASKGRAPMPCPEVRSAFVPEPRSGPIVNSSFVNALDPSRLATLTRQDE